MLAGILAPSSSSIQEFRVNDPNLYTLEEWASSMPSAFNDTPRLVGDWQTWADALCSSRIGLLYGIPSSDQFDNWKDWAVRVYQVLQ